MGACEGTRELERARARDGAQLADNSGVTERSELVPRVVVSEVDRGPVRRFHCGLGSLAAIVAGGVDSDDAAFMTSKRKPGATTTRESPAPCGGRLKTKEVRVVIGSSAGFRPNGRAARKF